MMVFKKNNALNIEKNGVTMRIYNDKDQCGQAAVAYQETEKGHFEEFSHSKSFFIFYIIEGKGVWFIEEKPHDVEAGDVVIIPPNTKFYYKGKLKQVCVTSPAWEADYEKHARDIER
jgi:mannose-6-phosphate isomerase-like protein (cupin superfamily)